MCDEFAVKAKGWDEDPMVKGIADVFLKVLKKNFEFSYGLDLLEFGCGTGLIGLDIANSVHSITMLDNSPAMFNILKAKVKAGGFRNVECVLGDVKSARLEHGSFDMIFSSMALHHVENISELLEEFYKYLTPNGCLVIADLDLEDGSFHEKEVAHNGFSSKKLINLFNNAGFQIKYLENHYAVKKEVDGEEEEYDLFFLVSNKDKDLRDSYIRDIEKELDMDLDESYVDTPEDTPDEEEWSNT